MTKQQLLDALLAKAEVLAIADTTSPQAQPDGTNRYIVNLKVSTGDDSINYVNRAYYVEDEGGAGETAYWENSEPYPATTPTTPFTAKVSNLIESKITDGTIKGATIVEVNDANRTAYVRAIKAADNTEVFGFVTDANNDDNLEINLV